MDDKIMIDMWGGFWNVPFDHSRNSSYPDFDFGIDVYLTEFSKNKTTSRGISDHFKG